MDDAPQVAAGYDQPGTRAAARRSGSGRDLDWRDSGRIERKPAAQGTESRAGPGGCGETRPRNRARSNSCHPGFQHVPRPQPLRIDLRKGAKSVLPLADRAIGNLQQWLIGTYHGVSHDQLQVYLDEFVFRHNRRGQPMAAFRTLLGLGTGRKPTAYQQIRGGKDLQGRSNQDPSQHIESC